jgi:ribosomal protein L29
MATKAFKEILKLSKDELGTKARSLEADLFKARMKSVTGQLEDTSSVWRMRKDLARVKMLMSQTAAKSAKAAR